MKKIKDICVSLANHAIRVFRSWNEAWILVLGILLWNVQARIFRWMDPTAAPLDAGYLHTITFACLAFGAISLFVWMGIRLNFKKVWDFFEIEFDSTFCNLQPCEKLKYSLIILSLYLVCAVIVFMGVISGAA